MEGQGLKQLSWEGLPQVRGGMEAPLESSALKEKETPAEKSKDSGSTFDLSGSRETPSCILLGSNQGSGMLPPGG